MNEPPRPDRPLPHPALLLLAGSRRRVCAHDGRGAGMSWLVLGLTGLAWGLALAGIFSLTGMHFRWHAGLPLTQTAAVLLAIALGPFRRCLPALAGVMDDESPAAQAAMAALLLGVLTLALLQIDPAYTPSAEWFRPYGPLRPLLLLPMWGVWAMMVPAHFCRPAEQACPLTRAFLRQQPVAATALWMALPLAGTLWQIEFMRWWVLLPLVAGSVGSVWLCRARGGVRRQWLLAANMLTQLAFLLAYLGAKDT